MTLKDMSDERTGRKASLREGIGIYLDGGSEKEDCLLHLPRPSPRDCGGLDAEDGVTAGKKVILPPTIYGSPRWYAESFQDAMALVRKYQKYGKLDHFITMTTNPNWPEILCCQEQVQQTDLISSLECSTSNTRNC